MVPYLIFGATYAFAAAVQPGPLMTYLISQTLCGGWRRSIPAALAPVVGDGPIIVLVLVVLSRFPMRAVGWLRLGGGVFLFYLAARAFRAWRAYSSAPASEQCSGRRSLANAVVVNLLNPNPYLGWSLVLGPLLLKGWRESPSHGLALVLAFYGTITVCLAGIVALFAGAQSLGPRVGRVLVGVSAVALAAFGCYQLWAGGHVLLRG
jgi:threonine/homoserine/homoserine lactone efflux protein